MTDTTRLSPQQWQMMCDRAQERHQQVLATARKKEQNMERVNFYPELFRLAADQIEHDVNGFCDRAQMLFEEIEAFGHEPQLAGDWLQELTGEKDNFYFSTDSLLSELPPLPGQKRGRKPSPPDEAKVIEAVQQAISEAEAQDVLSVAHLENPSDWIHKIAIALRENHGTADFGLLRQATGLSPGALFLGLLLGQDNWRLRQTEFYGQVTAQIRN